MNLSLVIPAYDEEKRILKTLEKVHDFLLKNKFDFEIIVVNDGSTDDTEKMVDYFSKQHSHVKLINNPGNKGKGYSVKNGMLHARKDWVLFSDADLSTPIEDLNKFEKYTKKYDIIFGSRGMKNSRIVVKQPWYRRIPGKIFPVIVRLLVLPDFHDTQCGFKMFRKSVIKDIFEKQTIDGWAFDVELLFIAKKSGHMIKEVPVTWKNDLRSKISPLKSSISMLNEIIKIKMNNFKGIYD
ncbi:MAG: dolichyl-phosphate beta-glucosyltransferase [Candidatus Woesearchaeota archaeon]